MEQHAEINGLLNRTKHAVRNCGSCHIALPCLTKWTAYGEALKSPNYILKSCHSNALQFQHQTTSTVYGCVDVVQLDSAKICDKAAHRRLTEKLNKHDSTRGDQKVLGLT